jgi:hypothetical protein
LDGFTSGGWWAVTAVFFGERWDAPIVDEAVQVPTPVGTECLGCGEPVVDGDRGFIRVVLLRSGSHTAPVHAECDMLGVMGHQYGVCSCTGFGTGRAAARELWRRVGDRRGRPLEDRPGDYR